MKTLNMIAGMLLLSTLFLSCDKNEHIPEEKHYALSIQPDAASGKDAVVSSIVPQNNY